MRPPAAPMLSLEGVVKTRSQAGSRFTLRVPRFSVGAGQLVALVGASGCGKSTLLDMLALVMAPTEVARFDMTPAAGAPTHDVRALWADEDEAALAALRRDHLGYVLQTGGLLPFLNVHDNIALPGRIKGGAPDPARIAALATRLGVAGCLARMPDSLSIGQRQRVAILRALAHRPRLVLADEPTAAVDKARARAIMDDMQALARDEGVAVVLVTHDVDLVAGRADATYGFDTAQVTPEETCSDCRPLAGGAR